MLFSSKHKIRLYHAGETNPFVTIEIESQHIEMLDPHTIKSDTSVMHFGSNTYVAIDD